MSFSKPEDTRKVRELIESAATQLENVDENSDEYAFILKQYETLTSILLRLEESEDERAKLDAQHAEAKLLREFELAKLTFHYEGAERDREHELTKLRLQGEEAARARKDEARLNKDRLKITDAFNGAVHIAGIVAVLGYEHAHPIISRAFGMLRKS